MPLYPSPTVPAAALIDSNSSHSESVQDGLYMTSRSTQFRPTWRPAHNLPAVHQGFILDLDCLVSQLGPGMSCWMGCLQHTATLPSCTGGLFLLLSIGNECKALRRSPSPALVGMRCKIYILRTTLNEAVIKVQVLVQCNADE